MRNNNREMEFLSLFHRNLNMPTLDSILNDLKNYEMIYDTVMFEKEAHKHLM